MSYQGPIPPGPMGPPPGAGAAPPADPLMLLAMAKSMAQQNPELLAILTQLEAMLAPPAQGPQTGMEALMDPGIGGMFPGA